MSYPAIAAEDRVTKGREMTDLEEPWKRCVARLRAELGEDVTGIEPGATVGFLSYASLLG